MRVTLRESLLDLLNTITTTSSTRVSHWKLVISCIFLPQVSLKNAIDVLVKRMVNRKLIDKNILRLPGAIIGDGDRKRAPFLVLGLAP